MRKFIIKLVIRSPDAEDNDIRPVRKRCFSVGFLLRDTMHKPGLCRRAVSVCLGVRHVLVCCVFSNVFTAGYPHHSSFSIQY